MNISGNRPLIGVIAALLLLFVAAVFFYNRTLNDLAAGSCTEDASICPHAKIVEAQNYVIAALVAVIIIMAGWLGYDAYFAKPKESKAGRGQEEHAAQSTPARRKRIAESELDLDEARVVAVVNSAGGSVFQSDIMKTTGFSKVKVSRLLDRLEQKGLTERKRRGMTNLVVAK